MCLFYFCYIVFEIQFTFYTYNKPRFILRAFLGLNNQVELAVPGWTAKRGDKARAHLMPAPGYRMSSAFP